MLVLIVEDDQDLAELTLEYLESQSIECDIAYNGVMGLELIKSNQYDVIIMDIMMPRMDGLTLCATMRNSGIATPCLMLTAQDSLEDKIAGFKQGADDYLVKPFELEELLVRLYALSRRHSNPANRLVVADLQLDLTVRIATRAELPLSLSPIEWKLLEILMRESPKVVSRTQLENIIWNGEPPSKDALKTQIYRLRKVVDKENQQQLIHTIRGAGITLRINHEQNHKY